MSRARNLKPGFFKNERLAECHPLARILFAGLWCESDREGRLEDRPKRLKAEYLPYDNCDANKLLDELQSGAFIRRYVVNGVGYIAVLSFAKHQNPHIREPASTIPAPDENSASTVPSTASHLFSPALSPFPLPDSKETASQFAPSENRSTLAAVLLPLNDGTEFPVTEQQVREFSDLYPAVDVLQSLRAMRGWCVTNPTNRKTRAGILRFVNRWLAKQQDGAPGDRDANRTRSSKPSLVEQAEAAHASRRHGPIDEAA